MQNDATIIQLPSGATMRLEDPDGQLQKCFTQLFGSTEAAATVVEKTRQRNRRRQYGNNS